MKQPLKSGENDNWYSHLINCACAMLETGGKLMPWDTISIFVSIWDRINIADYTTYKNVVFETTACVIGSR